MECVFLHANAYSLKDCLDIGSGVGSPSLKPKSTVKLL